MKDKALKQKLASQRSKNNIIEKVVLLFFILALFIIGFYAYWLTANYDVLKLYDRKTVNGKKIVKEINTLKVINKNVASGGLLKIHFDYCKTVRATGEVEVYLVDSVMKSKLNYPTLDETKPGCPKPFDLPLEMPTTIVTRERWVCFVINYHPNPLRTVKEEFCSEKFLLKEVKL